MKINVGSGNEIKIKAVREAISDYGFLSGAKVFPMEVSSEVSVQPKSIEEIIRGAKNRALNAFSDCDYSFGIESGLMQVPHTKTGYMNVCACAVYGGREYFIGLSSAFEYPPGITKLVLENEFDISRAFHLSGLTKNPKIGSAEGSIGVLTKDRIMRKEYIKQAVVMALIPMENKELY
jgi:inosine/xanthosine triphosphatase